MYLLDRKAKLSPMKHSVLFCLAFLPALAFAQFPAPDSFQIDIDYILLGEWGHCDGQSIQGPAYCNYFHWQAPDTTNTPATLRGYRIYKDGEFFLATANTEADSAGAYMHVSFYVTAVYENPAGESAPSNSVYIGDLPIGVGEAFQQEPISIGFDPAQRALIIRGAERARALRVYDGQGRIFISMDTVPGVLQVEDLPAGVYGVKVEISGVLYCKMFVMADFK